MQSIKFTFENCECFSIDIDKVVEFNVITCSESDNRNTIVLLKTIDILLKKEANEYYECFGIKDKKFDRFLVCDDITGIEFHYDVGTINIDVPWVGDSAEVNEGQSVFLNSDRTLHIRITNKTY